VTIVVWGGTQVPRTQQASSEREKNEQTTYLAIIGRSHKRRVLQQSFEEEYTKAVWVAFDIALKTTTIQSRAPVTHRMCCTPL
jgi:hypothetical protein